MNAVTVLIPHSFVSGVFIPFAGVAIDIEVADEGDSGATAPCPATLHLLGQG